MNTGAWDGQCRSRWRIRSHRMLFRRWVNLRCERVFGHDGLHQYGRYYSPFGLPLVWTDDMARRSTAR